MKKLLLGILVLSLPYLVNAECTGIKCSAVKISRLYVTSDDGGKVAISTSGDESKLECDAGIYGYLVLEPTQPAFEEIYAFLLASHSTQNPVTIRTSDTGSCKILYVISDK